nr:hypothetical protein [Tanacetum cinerariifolium]
LRRELELPQARPRAALPLLRLPRGHAHAVPGLRLAGAAHPGLRHRKAGRRPQNHAAPSQRAAHGPRHDPRQKCLPADYWRL